MQSISETTRTATRWAVCAALAMGLVVGCTSGPSVIEDNSGRVINTSPGEPIQESWLYGKWDIDGERTNTARGDGDVTAIPSDIIKDVLGEGVRLEPNGVAKFDRVVGYSSGTWSIESPDTLVLQRPGRGKADRYSAHFRSGFLYLKHVESGHVLVYERDKFFGT